jgi:hypothetical protein
MKWPVIILAVYPNTAITFILVIRAFCRLTHKFAKKGIYASETGVGACNACLCIISTF